MSSSAINAQLFQAKIGSIQNQADTSAVYSAGVWDFKNASAVTSVRIDGSGNVGIGTSSPQQRLHVAGNIQLGAASFPAVKYADNANDVKAEIYYGIGGNDLSLLNYKSGPIVFSTNNTERMRIDASGQLILPAGLTGGNLHTINGSSTTTTVAVNFIKPTGADSTSNYYLNFTTNTNQQGYIWNDAAGNIALATVSDESLKENIRPLDSGITKIKQLNPVVYNWKSGCAKDSIGFIAQEFEQVFPNAVGEMEGIKAIGFGPEFYAVLVKAVQEQQAQIEALKAEVAALKAP